jgi:two-component system cell cycle sensor histidine kinase/response regulator CckA
VHELLLVEDHPLLRAATALALRREGFAVHAAGGGPEALELLAAHPAVAVALLEIDLGPGGPDGFAFAAAACALRPGLGIVFLTGRADLLVGRVPGEREAHLVKPCPVGRVAETVRRMMR